MVSPRAWAAVSLPPGHRVAVPGGRRREHPQVRHLQQQSGQRPVVGVHRVQVRGVDEGEAGRHPGVRPDVGEHGQRVGGERGGVVGVDGNDGGAGGRPQHARGADRRAHDRVEQAGLPGPGGTAEDDDGGHRGPRRRGTSRASSLVQDPRAQVAQPGGAGQVEGKVTRATSARRSVRISRRGGGTSAGAAAGAALLDWALTVPFSPGAAAGQARRAGDGDAARLGQRC